MVHGKNRIPYWIDRRLNGLAGPDYDATISFGLPFEPEDSQYGKYRIRRGYTIHRPINQKKEQIGTIRRNVSDLTATWFRKNLPGLFSSGLLHGELPTCELITLRKAEPFPTTADGDCLPPIYLDVLGLSHSFAAWKSTTNVGLKLSFSHDSRDAQRQYMTVAVKESRLIEAMSDLWVDRGRSSRIAYLDQILAHLMGLWAILPMLEGYGRHIREVRDSVIAVSDNRKNSLELLNMLGRHISYSVDVAAVSSELIAASSDRFPLFGLGEPFVLCDTEQQPTENLESMLVRTIRDRAKWLQQSDAAIRGHLTQYGTLLGATENVRLQRRITWLTWGLVFFATVTLLVSIVLATQVTLVQDLLSRLGISVA